MACLSHSLTRFWTERLAHTTTMHAVLAPSPGQVPRDCRSALRLGTAFSCPSNDTVYLTAPFVALLRDTGPSDRAWVRIASTMGHEMGHIVQFTVHEPLVGAHDPSWARSRAVEQQADCLDGVWAASVGLDDAAFVAATRVVLSIVDSSWERRSHGTPVQRLAELRRGQHARTTAACRLRGRAH